jgi:hypothetical protein
MVVKKRGVKTDAGLRNKSFSGDIPVTPLGLDNQE